MATVVVLHVAVLILVLAARGASQIPTAEPGRLTAVALEAEQPAKAVAKPRKLPSKVIDKPTPVDEFALTEQLDSIANAVPAAGCSTLEKIRKAIIENPAAMASVHRAPPEARSVADAVVIWNAGWVDAAKSVDAPLGPARAAVEQVGISVDDACLDEALIGPRLIPFPAGDGTIFLVLGSGTWTWREVMLGPQVEIQMGERIFLDRILPSLWLDWPKARLPQGQ
ncbi:MAG: hypothetical protein M3Q52_01455 [Pseudomonadota bacterium]|nr:hypothetical protein [Pseudomonadota bacterium]